MKSFRGPLLAAATAICMGMLALAWYLRQPEQLVRGYLQNLAAAPDAEVELPLSHLAELGDAGVAALVEQLTSDRAAIRQSAGRVLLEEVDRWELLGDEAVGTRLGALARALSQFAPRMDRENRRVAADLAMRLLLWPRAEQNGTCPWLADCEAVLATAAERPRTADRGLAASASSIGMAASASSANGAPAGIADLGTSLADKVRLPGGGLPIDMLPMPEPGGFVEPRIAHSAPPVVDPHEPRRLQLPRDARSLDGQDNDDDADESSNDEIASIGANHPGRLQTASRNSHLNSVGLQAPKQSLGDPKADDADAWQRLEPRDVMRRLHGSDPQIVLAARVELERRGISGRQLELARQATDPDPKVRRALAESLPSLPGVDAKHWLVQLSYDDDPQVRATAVTLMATSGDLELVGRLEQISRDDPDDYVRAQANKAVRPAGRAASQ